jgi:peroxiredoxin
MARRRSFFSGLLGARAQEIEGQGVKIILVDVGEGKDQVQEYVDKRKVTLDILLDEDSSISSKYMVVGVPTFFLINKDGIVTSVEHSLSEDYLSLLTKAP